MQLIFNVNSQFCKKYESLYVIVWKLQSTNFIVYKISFYSLFPCVEKFDEREVGLVLFWDWLVYILIVPEENTPEKEIVEKMFKGGTARAEF